MRFLVLAAAALAVVGAMVVQDDMNDMQMNNMDWKDIKKRELMIMKLVNQILQPTMYQDIKNCAREFQFEMNMDKFMKRDVVKTFLDTYKRGMLPRGEIFVHTNERHMNDAIKVFHVMFFAKDFDTFVRCCCWMRERINEGMFVYALTVACLHRDDCRGIVLPAPYEIYPYFFVNSDVIHKAFMMKMKRGVIDPVLMDYYKIHLNDKNVCIIDSRKDLRHTLKHGDRINYFTEDIDLNTYFYYFNMDYPTWMTDDMFQINKERRGEIMMYGMMQLLARHRLERLAHGMCDIKPMMMNGMMKRGYWPKIRMHNGEEMPMRMNNMQIMNEDNMILVRMIEDMERVIRDATMTGRLVMRDGTVLMIQKPEDIETLCRMMFDSYLMLDQNKKIDLMTLMRKLLSYSMYNMNKNTYVPTALDMYQTNLRDPAFWKLMKRVTEICVLFKKMLPVYTRDEIDFPGVKIETVSADKLVTFFDNYDMDITNAVYMDKSEMKSMKTDMLFVARQRRLNNQPFKINIDIMSDKTVDAVIRVFLGPKYDCMGRLMDLNDKRLDMVEIDSFLQKLETGKNTIVRDSQDMHNVLGDRMWARKMWGRMNMNNNENMDGGDMTTMTSNWYRMRNGFPNRLLLPMGNNRGMEMQLFVIVTPVRMGMLRKDLDMETMKMRKSCRFTVCIDTMPLGFPLDRIIDMNNFFTNNMKFADVMIFHKDMDTINVSKMVDFTDMVMKRDDLTFMDKDMLVRSRFVDPMNMNNMDMDRVVDNDNNMMMMNRM